MNRRAVKIKPGTDREKRGGQRNKSQRDASGSRRNRVRRIRNAGSLDVALNLCRREVSLAQVRWAIWLGCARKYVAMLNGQTRQPITSLAYFASLIEEVRQPQIPASYWDHVRRRMEELEKRYLGNVSAPPATAVPEPSPPEML